MAPISDTTGSTHAAILGIGSYRPSRIVPNRGRRGDRLQ
jgi:hypothetical protein